MQMHAVPMTPIRWSGGVSPFRGLKMRWRKFHLALPPRLALCCGVGGKWLSGWPTLAHREHAGRHRLDPQRHVARRRATPITPKVAAKLARRQYGRRRGATGARRPQARRHHRRMGRRSRGCSTPWWRGRSQERPKRANDRADRMTKITWPRRRRLPAMDGIPVRYHGRRR